MWARRFDLFILLCICLLVRMLAKSFGSKHRFIRWDNRHRPDTFRPLIRSLEHDQEGTGQKNQAQGREG